MILIALRRRLTSHRRLCLNLAWYCCILLFLVPLALQLLACQSHLNVVLTTPLTQGGSCTVPQPAGPVLDPGRCATAQSPSHLDGRPALFPTPRSQSPQLAQPHLTGRQVGQRRHDNPIDCPFKMARVIAAVYSFHQQELCGRFRDDNAEGLAYGRGCPLLSKAEASRWPR